MTRQLGRLCMVVLIYFLAIGAGIPTLSRYVTGPLHGTRLDLGLAIAAFSVASIAARPVVMRAASRWESSRLIVAGCATVGCSAVGIAFLPSVTTVIVLRLVSGFGEAFVVVLAAAAVYAAVPYSGSSRALSYFTACLSGGLLAGPLLGEWLYSLAGFTGVWLTISGLCGLAAGVAAGIPSTPRPAAAARRRAASWTTVRVGLVVAANAWAVTAFGPFMVLYTAHLGIGTAGWAFLVFASATLGLRILSAAPLERVQVLDRALVALLLTAIGLALLASAVSEASLLVATAILGCGQAFAYPALVALAVSGETAERRTAVLSLITASLDGGVALAAITLGLVLQFAGFRALYGLASVVVAGAVIGLVRTRGRAATEAGSIHR